MLSKECSSQFQAFNVGSKLPYLVSTWVLASSPLQIAGTVGSSGHKKTNINPFIFEFCFIHDWNFSAVVYYSQGKRILEILHCSFELPNT